MVGGTTAVPFGEVPLLGNLLETATGDPWTTGSSWPFAFAAVASSCWSVLLRDESDASAAMAAEARAPSGSCIMDVDCERGLGWSEGAIDEEVFFGFCNCFRLVLKDVAVTDAIDDFMPKMRPIVTGGRREHQSLLIMGNCLDSKPMYPVEVSLSFFTEKFGSRSYPLISYMTVQKSAVRRELFVVRPSFRWSNSFHGYLASPSHSSRPVKTCVERPRNERAYM